MMEKELMEEETAPGKGMDILNTGPRTETLLHVNPDPLTDTV